MIASRSKLPRVVEAADLAAPHHHDAVAMPISSSISDEMNSTAAPSATSCVDDLVDLVFRADVDAAGRLVEDEDRRAA